jgi:hypothetical protein
VDRSFSRYGKEEKYRHIYGQKASRIDSTLKTAVQKGK